ncbi:MAG: hypothetical protein CME64_14375 [Halobacteriovoraceae bacterium]|nr:hypothetical protein [Halobacteriovoraceae bacterium]|tara:strand:+ start:76712 stop:76972 length:261 start_codon:yes stop_codon:yes gene_type:complete
MCKTSQFTQKNLKKMISFQATSLPFGAVIDKELFDKTQANVAVVEKLRGFNKKRSRLYALTGILQFEDGSRFTGNSGTARNGEPKY